MEKNAIKTVQANADRSAVTKNSSMRIINWENSVKRLGPIVMSTAEEVQMASTIVDENTEERNDLLRKLEVIKKCPMWSNSFERQKAVKNCLGGKNISEMNAAELTHVKSITVIRLKNLSTSNEDGKYSTVLNAFTTAFKRLFQSNPTCTHIDSIFTGKQAKNELVINVEKHGHALPPFIYRVLDAISENGINLVGVFRKSGRKASIMELFKVIDIDVFIDMKSYTLFDLADFVKSYLRGLQASLITENIMCLLVSVQSFPDERRLSLFQSVILLMPDENREALYVILQTCKKLADNSSVTKMDIYNLAVCLVPSIFPLDREKAQGVLNNFFNFKSTPAIPANPTNVVLSNGVTTTLSELHSIFAYLIEKFQYIFTVPNETFELSQMTVFQSSVPMELSEIGKAENDHYEQYMNALIDELYEEHRTKFKAWTFFTILNGVSISTRKSKDGHPLCYYRGVVEVNANSSEVLTCYLYKGSLWSGNTERFVVNELSKRSDLFYQRINILGDEYFVRDAVTLRKWRKINNCFFLASTSVKVSPVDLVNSKLSAVHSAKVLNEAPFPRASILALRLLVEPVSTNRTKLTMILRVDLKGRRASYYKHLTPFYISKELESLRLYYNKNDTRNVFSLYNDYPF